MRCNMLLVLDEHPDRLRAKYSDKIAAGDSRSGAE